MRHIKIVINITRLQKLLKYLAIVSSSIGGITIFIFGFMMYFQNQYKDQIYPNVYINNLLVGGLTKTQAENVLVNSPGENKISITSDIGNFDIPLKSIEFSYDYENSVEDTYNTYRSSIWIINLLQPIKSLFTHSKTQLRFTYSREKLIEHISVISGQVSIDPVDYSITIKEGDLIINPGKTGTAVNGEKLIAEIESRFASKGPLEIHLLPDVVGKTLNESEINQLTNRGNKLIGKSLSIVFEDFEKVYEDSDLVSLISPSSYDYSNIEKVVDTVEESINRDPQNPIFEFTTDTNGKTGHVEEFVPSTQGIKVKKEGLITLIVDALEELEKSEADETTITVPVETTAPDYSTEDVNDLGINELIGLGKSKFYHSIPSRVHNVKLASSHFNGVLVLPGEVFSFNDTLGDVSSYTGYQQAYVIQDGKTVLGDGGGVCQVSTTLFRAALDAGLPITERRAHSYRVGYYEQESPVGIDATVYSPTTDFKFKNDTPGHLLIQTKFDASTYSLIFEIYGTNDGRVSEISKPIITNSTPPPEDLYIDDPTLPEGQIKQIDWKAWGAKVYFDYTVERDGETIYEKTFYSNYKPWQSVYLRGTMRI